MSISMFSPDELKAITDLFDPTVELNPDDFIGFGLKNSRVYFSKLARLMGDSKLTREGKFMVFVLATAIKNRNRILEAMKMFELKPWFNSVQQFFVGKTCQYTGEEGPHTIAVIHIPSGRPTITARVWCMITPNINRTVDNFLSNLWAAQLDLDADLMAKHLVWEQKFWGEMVKKGSKNYNEGFHMDFWETKACDAYPLMHKSGLEVAKVGLKYDTAELTQYLGTFEVPRVLMRPAVPGIL